MAENDVSKQAHLHTREAAAISPFLQSVGTGFFFSAALFALLFVGRVQDAWKIALVAFVLVSAATWMGLQYRLLILTRLDDWSGDDLSQNTVTGFRPAPTETVHTVRVNVHETENGAHRVTVARFMATDEVMRELAMGLLRGKPFTEAEWTGPGKLLALAKFREIRDEMLARHLLKLRNPKTSKQGYELTRSGVEAMSQIIMASPTPGSERA